MAMAMLTPKTGERLPTPNAGATRPVDTLDLLARVPDRAILIEMSGPHAGRVHALGDGEFTIGRGHRCSLIFPDMTLSRTHAVLFRDGDEFIVEDLGSTNGTFVEHERVKRRVLRHGDLIRLGSGVRIQFQRVTHEEEQVLVRLYEASVRDGLTGVFNRRHLQERLTAEVAFASRHGTELAVLLYDLDHFKRVNDTYGHLAGDEVLKRVAQVVSGQVRREDLLARYGGEEFCLIVRDVPVRSALLLAERLRARIQAMEVSFEGVSLRVTASIGVAAMTSCVPPVTPEGLLARADEALYRAKESGRNRVAVAGPDGRPPEVLGMDVGTDAPSKS